MKITVKKGRHYPYLIPIAFPLCVSQREGKFRKAKFMFTESCLFDLHDEDQHDVNKLFGFSIGHHQKGSSFRFGWRPKLKTMTIEIVAYEYHDSVRQKTMHVCEVETDKWYTFRISYRPYSDTSFYFIDENGKSFTNTFTLKKKTGLGYTLGVYFGGNEKAPQDITIYKKK